MAINMKGLSDLIADALDLAPIEVIDVLKAVPLLDLLGMEESSDGVSHRYSKEIGAPVVGFRDVNEGRDHSKSLDLRVTVVLKFLDFSWLVDVAQADASRKGPAWEVAREGLRFLSAALIKHEQQVINGIIGAADAVGPLGDAQGFTGIRDAETVNALADPLVIDAAGTTIDGASSVYAVRLATNGVVGIYKGDGPAIQLGDTTVIQNVVDPGTDNKTHAAYYTPGGLWLAQQVGSAYDLARIANLTTEPAATLTDDLIAELLAAMPVGKAPTHLVMTRRSRMQLQNSRTATNPTGAPAPFPMEAFGVPIVTSDNVSDTETLLT